jgi:hypothetical protein
MVVQALELRAVRPYHRLDRYCFRQNPRPSVNMLCMGKVLARVFANYSLVAACQIAAVYLWFRAGGGAGALILPFLAAMALLSIVTYWFFRGIQPLKRASLSAILGIALACISQLAAVVLAIGRSG